MKKVIVGVFISILGLLVIAYSINFNISSRIIGGADGPTSIYIKSSKDKSPRIDISKEYDEIKSIEIDSTALEIRIIKSNENKVEAKILEIH